jgi:prepilin-type N-terminal cleavage/methylation domain-containing protein
MAPIRVDDYCCALPVEGLPVNIRSTRNQQGFSLPEILVVLVILSILAAIAIPSMLNQRTKSLEAAMSADLLTASAQLNAVLNSWRGVPPDQVNIVTANRTWTATVQAGEDVASDTLTSEGSLDGTIWTDGSYCIEASSSLTTTTLIYRSDEKRINKGTCPTTGFGGVGTVPGSVAADLPDAPGGVTATSTTDNTVDVSWAAVTDATSYTVSLSGVASKDVLGTTTQFTGVQPGVVNIVVFAKNANGTGAGTTVSVQVDGTTTYALSSRLNTYTYSVANQLGKEAIAGQPAGSTVWVVDTAWVETWTGAAWVVTGGRLPYAGVTRTSSQSVPDDTETVLTGTADVQNMIYDSGVITVPVAGRYEVNFYVLMSVAPTETAFGLVRVNGNVVLRANGVATSASGQSSIGGARAITLAAGDTVSLNLTQLSDAGSNVIASSTAPVFFDIRYIGPA